MTAAATPHGRRQQLVLLPRTSRIAQRHEHGDTKRTWNGVLYRAGAKRQNSPQPPLQGFLRIYSSLPASAVKGPGGSQARRRPLNLAGSSHCLYHGVVWLLLRTLISGVFSPSEQPLDSPKWWQTCPAARLTKPPACAGFLSGARTSPAQLTTLPGADFVGWASSLPGSMAPAPLKRESLIAPPTLDTPSQVPPPLY